jgi:tetratricopeptide (TPR) repeat protein
VGIISNNLGENARARGDFERALGYYEDALAIARETGNRESAISCFNNIGGVRLALGQPAAAEAALREVLARVGDRGWFGLSETSRYLAAAHLAQGRQEEALRAAQQALALAREGGQRDLAGAAWRMLARVAGESGAAVAPGADEAPLPAEACFERSAAFSGGRDGAEHAHTLYAWGGCTCASMTRRRGRGCKQRRGAIQGVGSAVGCC